MIEFKELKEARCLMVKNLMVELLDYRKWSGDYAKAVELFDCGNREINDYFKTKLSETRTEHTERIIVVADDDKIFGFVSLALDKMRTTFFREENYTVLVVNAIGIDVCYQNMGFGTQLLITAFRFALTVNEVIPIGGLYLIALVEAFDFYEKFDLKNLNAPPEMVPNQTEFQMVIPIHQIESLELTPFSDSINLT